MNDPTLDELEAERERLLAALDQGPSVRRVRRGLLRKLAGVEFWQALIATKQAAVQELEKRGPG